MQSMTLRYACYDCKFACVPRQGDITLADYWGASKLLADKDTEKGVSLVLTNTPLGKEIWDIIKRNCIYVQSSIEDAARENGNLVNTTKMPDIRSRCYREIQSRGYKDVAHHEFRCDNYLTNKIKQSILHSSIRPFILQIRSIFKD